MDWVASGVVYAYDVQVEMYICRISQVPAGKNRMTTERHTTSGWACQTLRTHGDNDDAALGITGIPVVNMQVETHR